MVVSSFAPHQSSLSLSLSLQSPSNPLSLVSFLGLQFQEFVRNPSTTGLLWTQADTSSSWCRRRTRCSIMVPYMAHLDKPTFLSTHPVVTHLRPSHMLGEVGYVFFFAPKLVETNNINSSRGFQLHHMQWRYQLKIKIWQKMNESGQPNHRIYKQP